MSDTDETQLGEIRSMYTSRRGKQKAFTREVDSVLRRIIKAKKIDVVNIESRTKSVDSVCEKSSRDDKNYLEPLEEITDLTGCRVICYYTADIEKVADLGRALIKWIPFLVMF